MEPASLSPAKVLVCDDEQDVLASARFLFKGESMETQCASNPVTAFELIQDQDFDMVLLDLNYSRDTTSGKEGIELISRIREYNPKLPIVVMTAWATVDIAVDAMRQGANDFITKPWENDRLLSIARNMHALSQSQLREQRLKDENTLLRQNTKGISFVASSSSMRAIMDTVDQIAPSDANVVITGENGTGKSILAKKIHELSPRTNGPFISVNMGGVSESLFESELFGHVKGAFTDAKTDRIGRYELADGGTLFLDEIGELSQNHQTTLLRLLETGEFERLGSSRTRKANVRIISATNADLDSQVQSGSFRRDLFYRLNTVPLRLPPLRERLEDMRPLAEAFLNRYSKRYKKDLKRFSDAVWKNVESHDWPGNIRELDHAIERAVLLTKGDTIEAASLGITHNGSRTQSLDEMSLEEVEAYLIRKAMKRSGGNANLAAESLGLSRSAFYRRLQKYDL